MKLIVGFGPWLIPIFIASVLLFAYRQKVAVLDEFIIGSKEGLGMVLTLFPYLLAMLVAVELLSVTGVFHQMARLLEPLLLRLSWPPETLPLAILRPLSNSGSLAITAGILERSGPDSLTGMIASVMQGSTDTTLFIVTVYFASVGIKKIRHALWAGLCADLAAMLASIYLCRLLLM